MKILTSREKIIFIICAALVSAYLGNLLMIQPARSVLNHLDEEIQAEMNKYYKNERLIEKSTRSKAVHQAYQEQFKQSKSSDQMMAVILAEIEKEASAYNLRISDLKPKRGERLKDYNVFSVSVALDSEFNQMISFLHTLQSPPYFFGVDEFFLDKGGVRNSTEVKTRLVLRKVLIP